jgi:hypothetical protein
MRNADTVLGIIQDRYALEQGSLESHVIRKAVMRGSERGRWKSTHLGNSLAPYSTPCRHAPEFDVDVICRHPTTPYASLFAQDCDDLLSPNLFSSICPPPCGDGLYRKNADILVKQANPYIS